MSQDFHHHQQGIFSFTAPPSAFDRASDHAPDESQIRIRDTHTKIRLPGFDHHAPEGASASGMHPGVYETAGMLSEMLNFGAAPGGPQIPGAGMQFFLGDPHPRSTSPPPPPPPPHVLLPTQQHEFMNWVDPEGGGGLSLSLSSTLEAAKAEEEMRLGGEMMFFGGGSHQGQQHNQNQQHVMHLQGYGLGHQPPGHFGFGSILASPAAASLGAVNSLRNSKFMRPAQELLDEFCSVGRGQLKKNKFSRNDSICSTTSSAATGPSSSNSAKDVPPLSPSDRMEHQRRKVKLISMLDEVERRYSQYCEQMQMVVNSFDVVMGYGAATPYTALAQRAMSRHFRCLKDAIQAQLKHSCELLGEKDVSTTTGLTKGETPRLKALEQSLRQQRAFHQMGMMEQEAWRPQRGLPERSVNVLRAWLFEHFLHPYPSDADKHLLARQTGLSRNQVSNWFINARVRLWKPMVEEMYQQESKDEDDDDGEGNHPQRIEDEQQDQDQEEDEDNNNNNNNNDTDDNIGNEYGRTKNGSERETNTNSNIAQTSMSAATTRRSHFNAADNDPSFFTINDAGVWPPAASHFVGGGGNGGGLIRRHDQHDGVAGGPAIISFGAAATGDVSLTLGLRHAAAGGSGGNPPEKSGFSFREFGS